MPQMVVSLKVLLLLLIIVYISLHAALYYSTGFNLVAETVKFFGWLFDSLRWLINQVRGIVG